MLSLPFLSNIVVINIYLLSYAPLIPQTHLTNPSIIQTIILNKQNLPCLPHKLFSSL
ncbi:Hypothetical protein C248_2570 [Staphylococcus aureus 08BA02176]|nr:Hypothetical protein C248_2570 [Staphylococcus aureus 08BA02176]